MKITLRILKWLALSMLGLLFLVFLLLAFENGSRSVTLSEAEKKAIQPQKTFDQAIESSHYDSLLAIYGKNKTLAPGFELQCLLALSHYPELKDTRMEFRVEPAFLPLASRPDPLSLLLPWKKRTYLVIISNKSKDFFEPILLKNTPFNDQIGIVGHELGHTLFYQDKSALQLAVIAYKYQYNERFSTAFERETDKRAVAHGLGYQMYDFAYFVRRAFGQSEESIEKEEGDMYLSPNEILKEMKKYDFYDENHE